VRENGEPSGWNDENSLNSFCTCNHVQMSVIRFVN
jgi:hypothetical protein